MMLGESLQRFAIVLAVSSVALEVDSTTLPDIQFLLFLSGIAIGILGVLIDVIGSANE